MAAMETEPDGAKVSEDDLAALTNADSLMEVDAFKTLMRFVKAGGQPETVVGLLADNYRGYAQMCNLVCQWLEDAGGPEAGATRIMQSHIEEVVHREFDDERAQGIFDDMEQAPWLTEMIGHDSWRSMLYKLSEHHRNSLMLNFAIKRICTAGYHDEICGVQTVANQLDVYSSVLCHVISNLAEMDEAAFEQHIGRFCAMVVQSQHTYVYAQCLLHAAMKTTENRNFLRRLSQQVQLEAIERGHAVVPHDLLLFSGSLSYQHVATALGDMLSQKSLNTADIMVLFKAYSADNPPPVEMLRLPNFFDLFEKDLFTPDRSVPEQYLENYAFVLAYAVCVQDNDGSGSEHLHDTISAIVAVVGTLKEAAVRHSVLSSLLEHLKWPVISKGVLHWISCCTEDTAFFAQFSATEVPVHLRIVDEIVLQHRHLWPTSLQLLSKVYTTSYPLDALIDVKRMLLDRLVLLLAAGHTIPVLAFVSDHVSQTDISLVVHFVVETLKYTGPPYSPEFVAALLSISGRPEVLIGFRKKSQSHTIIVSFFRDAAKTAGLSEPTASQVKTLLKENAWMSRIKTK